MTITGTGFLAGATVTLGGTAATNVTVVNSTTITATTPAHAAGAVNVVVRNTDGQSGTLHQSVIPTPEHGWSDRFRAGGVGDAGKSRRRRCPVTYPVAQTAGNLNVVVVGWNDTTSTVTSVVTVVGTVTRWRSGRRAGTGCGSRCTTRRTSWREATR